MRRIPLLFSDHRLGLPLPVASPLHHDESGNGYALRMAVANGIPFSELAGLVASPGHRYMPAKAAPILAYLFGGSSVEIQRAIPKHRVSNGKTRVAFMGHTLNRSYLVRHTWPQVCPACLCEYGYAKALWDLAMSVACEIHRVVLVDRCNMCDRRLSWRRPSLNACWCGHTLSELPGIVAGDDAYMWSLQLARLLAAEVVHGRSDGFVFLNGLDFDMCQRLVRACGLSALYEGKSVQPGTLVRQRSSPEMLHVVVLGLQRCEQLMEGAANEELVGDDLFEAADDALVALLNSRFGLKQRGRGRKEIAYVQLEFQLHQGGD